MTIKSPSSSYNSLLWFPVKRVSAGIVKLVDLTELNAMSLSQTYEIVVNVGLVVGYAKLFCRVGIHVLTDYSVT